MPRSMREQAEEQLEQYDETIICVECGDELIKMFAKDHTCESKVEVKQDEEQKGQEEAKQDIVFQCPYCQLEFNNIAHCDDHIQAHIVSSELES